ncbi:FHA domain-containing protein [Acaryochloris sp. 'Moss Beach']|uniref:FHA domain-containing protein n=1 Tax=Acaryochloris sp. 'Moss Beach' TaxID=2740837 RepID=UPI001F16D609|nr:FHA domain-containing protein [Acaryochloris sp. 'Moss Beach']UJB68524.1 FHA domain-containing protein [Acaryochloris sp. 'Moss Beach']
MTSAPTPQLIITGEIPQQIDLTRQKTWTLGRSSINAIVLAEGAVSRHHAKLEVVDNRHCYFVDLNSSNGSQINQKRANEPLLLKHGDVITIGSTDIRFHLPYVTHSGATVPFRPKQVLMMQESATQGIIWQEILCSQGFDVHWLPPAADLQQRMNLDAAANVLPDLLLVDIEAYKGDALGLCSWCQDTYPQLPLFLTLSTVASAAIVETNVTLPTGTGKILPAFPCDQLSLKIGTFVQSLQSLLNGMGGCTLNQQDLMAALANLDQILSRSSVSPGAAPTFDNDLDEFTILDNKKKPKAS